ncbi:mucin-21 isoform X4 [Amia ocellicauda]|uniref:mucin-21 isoform X4 n=1 Tax=Amia ocellicauda TaxID=2972642 RepID=UPI0034649F99
MKMLSIKLGVLLVCARAAETQNNNTTSNNIESITQNAHTTYATKHFETSTLINTSKTTHLDSNVNSTVLDFPAATSVTSNITSAVSKTSTLTSSSSTPESTTITTSSQSTGGSTPAPSTSSHTGIIILIALILAILLFVIIIFCIHKKTRRYSFDLYQKGPEDAGIPLSSVERDGVTEAISPKDNLDIENVNEQKVANETQTSAEPPPTETGSEKPNTGAEKAASENTEDSFGSQIPLTPLDGSVEFNLDATGTNTTQSSKTSIESLGDPPNENNNNIARSSSVAKAIWAKPTLENIFTEIHLE